MASRSAAPARPFQSQLPPLELLLIAGLAGVFVVNAIVAVFEPSDLTGLLERSLVGRTIPTMSDRWVAWAGAWLLAVALVKLTALEAFGG